MILKEKSKLERRDRFDHAKSQLLGKINLPKFWSQVNNDDFSYQYHIVCGLHSWVFEQIIHYPESYHLVYYYKKQPFSISSSNQIMFY